MGLATPTAIMVGTGRAAESGILIRGGAALEGAGEVDTVVFDKTGTLTLGRPEVVRIAAVAGATDDDVLRLAAALEPGSGHPLATAITGAARDRGLVLSSVTDFESVGGRGVSGRIDQQPVLVGSARFLVEQGVEIAALRDDGNGHGCGRANCGIRGA